MKIAVASGKGGTGKTMVATNLAWVAARRGLDVAYVDCDVEEPNGRIFLRPSISHTDVVTVQIPQVDEAVCTHCRECSEVCQFGAIACLGKGVVVFAELCHGCGGCSLACPAEAISEVSRGIGSVTTGRAGSIHFAQGTLNVGEAQSPPVIRAVKAAAAPAELVIRDAPPGTSCPVIETLRDCDFVVLVTEPTPFGRHDLILMVETVRTMKLPFGVVINRAGLGDSGVQRFCQDEGIRLLAVIRDDRGIAEAYSRGELMAQSLPAYERVFVGLLEAVTREATLAECA